MSIKINKILDVKAYLNGELIPELSYELPKCELFSICNCKTAMCRVALPDESCYYYRYFKKIIVEDKMSFNKIDLNNLIKEIIDEVKKEKIEAEITMNPEELNLKFSPWEPFRYNCPYQNSKEN